MWYRVNVPSVAYEIFDDETALLNLERGSYYSQNSSASEIWRLMITGVADNDLPIAVGQRFGIQPPFKEVAEFVQDLVTQRLIILDATTAERGEFPAPSLREPWSKPTIVVYDDMRDLLAMDPPLPPVPSEGV
jgi:hypothetical protein